MSDLAAQLSKQLQAKEREISDLRGLLGDVYTALLVAGWRDEVLIQRVREVKNFARNHLPAGALPAAQPNPGKT